MVRDIAQGLQSLEGVGQVHCADGKSVGKALASLIAPLQVGYTNRILHFPLESQILKNNSRDEKTET